VSTGQLLSDKVPVPAVSPELIRQSGRLNSTRRQRKERATLLRAAIGESRWPADAVPSVWIAVGSGAHAARSRRRVTMVVVGGIFRPQSVRRENDGEHDISRPRRPSNAYKTVSYLQRTRQSDAASSHDHSLSLANSSISRGPFPYFDEDLPYRISSPVRLPFVLPLLNCTQARDSYGLMFNIVMPQV